MAGAIDLRQIEVFKALIEQGRVSRALGRGGSGAGKLPARLVCKSSPGRPGLAAELEWVWLRLWVDRKR